MNTEDFFVPDYLALQLKDKGFNKPCLKYINNHHSFKNGKFVPKTLYQAPSKGNFSLNATAPHIYLDIPMYAQAIDWLFEKGFNLHSYWMADDGMFGCDVYDISGGLLFSDLVSGNGGKYKNKYHAYNKAIEETLKLMIKTNN